MSFVFLDIEIFYQYSIRLAKISSLLPVVQSIRPNKIKKFRKHDLTADYLFIYVRCPPYVYKDKAAHTNSVYSIWQQLNHLRGCLDTIWVKLESQ